eukprot:10421591-Prorocentrum_lima.AAC.1
MTSSLVGSEMCIRDRGCALPPSMGTCVCRPLHCKVLMSRNSFSYDAQTVSYTHLTLPTICSV